MMKLKMVAITAAALLALGVQSAIAQQVAGRNVITVPGNSDVLLSVPFNNQNLGTYTVTAKDADGIFIAGGLAAGVFNQPAGKEPQFYVRFTSGNASGAWMSVTSNTASELVLDGSSAKARTNFLSLVGVNDTFRVYKHLTLGSVFPKKNFDTGLAGRLTGSFRNNTYVLIYDNTFNSVGINKTPVITARYSNAQKKWTGSAAPGYRTPDNDTVLQPETLFILRNTNASPLMFRAAGKAADFNVKVLVNDMVASNDMKIGTGYPVRVLLSNSGMGGMNNRYILLYNNKASGQNKAPLLTARYSTAQGKWVGTGVDANTAIKGMDGIIFRLPANEAVTTVTINKPY